ncbi:HET-domain-containing protein [Hyaloscypha hepaticicola]|uniref:HET-domain-containing protein n=1 Tax=Hyaloscypha hepaticicola TaxID=2082293 RepID=A0A2J6Q898_9HELO|nr:HET-domain-containing protein [Hyaloscypha hepaticicola]
MWLLDTSSLALSAFFDKTPHYVILSHTWGSEEVSFQDIQGSHDQISHRAGYKKIKDCCAKASEAGFRYVWIDTCCIDKTNSTELSEAINSMFRWYKNSTTCYAYLEDVEPEGPRFVGSRWFTRGWTLQELIAPTDVQFFDRDWNEIGSRVSLKRSIKEVTGIPEPVLRGYPLRDNCVAEIMSWAAGRHTTRIEDRAYSLLGLFGVNMPLIYGEGENAFLRLQLEIIKITTDHSILAWEALPFNQWKRKGALATTVDQFRGSGRVRSFPVLDQSSFEMTNLGLRITLPSSSKLHLRGNGHSFNVDIAASFSGSIS